MAPDKRMTLRWTGEGTVFEGGPVGGPAVVIDGSQGRGPSPMDALLLGLAGCMAADVQTILEKSRVPMEALDVRAEGWRAPEPPRRYTRIQMVFTVVGPAEDQQARLQRALDLSREKYCSVLHTLRPDLSLDFEIHRA